MRSAYHDKNFFTANGEVVGVSLGYDHCAEHEFGVRGIKAALGYSEPEFHEGIRTRIIPAISEKNAQNVRFRKDKTTIEVPFFANLKQKTKTVPCAELWVDGDLNWLIAESQNGRYEKKFECPPDFKYLKHSNDPKSLEMRKALWAGLDALDSEDEKESRVYSSYVTSEWDGEAFRVQVIGEKRVQALGEIYKALMEGRATLSLSGSNNPFSGRGLCLMIADRIPAESHDNVLKADLEYKRMMDMVKATGIKDKLEKAGCKYYALSPRFDENGDLKFWLNPQDQRDNNHGWYTLAELEAWTLGAGPVVKKSNSA